MGRRQLQEPITEGLASADDLLVAASLLRSVARGTDSSRRAGRGQVTAENSRRGLVSAHGEKVWVRLLGVPVEVEQVPAGEEGPPAQRLERHLRLQLGRVSRRGRARTYVEVRLTEMRLIGNSSSTK